MRNLQNAGGRGYERRTPSSPSGIGPVCQFARDSSHACVKIAGSSSERFMTTHTRTNPLSYLTDQLNDLKQKGTYFKLRVLDDEQARGLHLRRQEGHQPGVQQLPRPDHASQAARSRAGGHPQVRRRLGRGAHHRRHHEDPHGAGREDRALQECRSLRGLPVGLHRQRGHGVGDAGQGRLHRLRRAEPRQHHRRRAPVARQDQGLPPQGRRPTPKSCSTRSRTSPATSCSSPTASFPWTATSARCPR